MVCLKLYKNNIMYNNNIVSICMNSINIKPKCKRNPIKMKPVNLPLTYDNHINHNITLKSYKLIELKQMCKLHRLKISGTKPILIERILCTFNKIFNVSIIQRNVRRWIVTNMMRLRGPALKNRKMCVNCNDFITLDNLTEIPCEYFYSYADSAGFVYGFNIISLIQMISKNNVFENPYNREIISKSQIAMIVRLFSSTLITCSIFNAENIIYKTQRINTFLYINRRRHSSFIRDIINVNRRQPIVTNVAVSTYHVYNPTIRNIVLTPEHHIRLDILSTAREIPIEQRIINLFIEIDNLGNYSHVGWFNDLTIVQNIRLFQVIFELWNFRGNLSNELKNNISPFHNPFDGLFTEIYRNDNIRSISDLQRICIIVFENILYSGIDEEDRKIGAKHILTAITMVSEPARESMPYLYESMNEIF